MDEIISIGEEVVGTNNSTREDEIISIGEEVVGTNNSTGEEVEKEDGAAFMEMLQDEMDPLKDERIWERMNIAMRAARTTVQNPAEVQAAAANRLWNLNGDVKQFISVIEEFADQINPFDILNILNIPALTNYSLLHRAVVNREDDILSLLVDYVPDLMANQNAWGDTPLHLAAKSKGYRAAAVLIRRARRLPNEDKYRILRMQNMQGNTALHEAVLKCDVDMVRGLLSEDLELVYLKNKDEKSPLYLTLYTRNTEIYEALFSLTLEPSRIQGLPPVHGAVVRRDYDFVEMILEKNMELFKMTDSGGGNVFHLAAYENELRLFEILLPRIGYLAIQSNKKGDFPIHIASKRGHVGLIERLHSSEVINGQGQTVLHVAAKYGRTSVVKYILKHPQLGEQINERDHAGNTALHLAAMHSQLAVLIALLLDKRNDFFPNHKSMTALDIAVDCCRSGFTFRKRLARLVLATVPFGKNVGVSGDLLILRPEFRDQAYLRYRVKRTKPNGVYVQNVINTRLLVATLVATVTFAAGFAVPGGFNSSDTASKDERGMATMLNKRMFQAYVICNTISMFCSMTAVVNLMLAQQGDVHKAITACRSSRLPLTIALPAMYAAFLTGVTLTVGKLPWLANTIFYLGFLFILIFLVARMLEYPPYFRSRHHPIRRLIFWLVLAYIYWWGVEANRVNDSDEDHSRVGDGESDGSGEGDGGSNSSGEEMTDDSTPVKSEDMSPPPPGTVPPSPPSPSH